MKKYLMTAAAAIAFCGTFTSCTHDDITTGNGKIDVVENYEQAFLTRFGQPAVNQTWGFGKVNAGTRAMIEEINDPFTNYGNTDGYYKTADDVPESAVTYSDFLNQDRWRRADWGGALDNNAAMNSDAEILIPEGTHTIKFTGGNHDFYVTGNATLNVPDYINAARIYVLPGKTFTLNMNNYINALEIYVAAGATLNYNYDKLYNQTGDAVIFNRGTVNLKKSNFEANQGSIVYNEGTINGTDITSKPEDGNPSYFYNYGEVILSGKFQLNSCANFYNGGTMTIAGETELTQGNGLIWWINKGNYTTATFKTAAWNGTMYNYCSLFITGDALMQNGQFYQMNGSYMEANHGVFNNFQFILANGAGVNIKSGSLWGRDGDDFRGKYTWAHQGFVAVDDNAKVWVRLGGDNKIPDHKGSAFHVEGANLTFGYQNVKFYHNIYYFGGEWNNTVNQFADESTAESLAAAKSENTIWDLHNVTKTYTGTYFSSVTATPKEDDCGATWTPDGDDDDDTRSDVAGIMIIAEDLTTGDKNVGTLDFDFNDVVFNVDYVDATTAKITLKAAGGTLPLVIGVPAGQEENESGQYHENEVHLRFGVSISTMVNTGTGSVSRPEPEPFYVTGNFTEENFAADCNNIRIAVKKNGEWVSLFAEKAKAASKMAVNQKFKWCDEREDIETKYSLFPNWVNDPSITWYW